MSYLKFTTATAETARNSLPPWPNLPTAHLSPGSLSAALAEVQAQEHSLIKATAAATRAHTAALADFTQKAQRLDSALARRLAGKL
ncbi:hypothetical protein [Corynebacterium mayonis]|uniref:hypothetical protein n=1 Tax=Corynebacterium mayonis TaxID=3062461 RepID=UPI00314086E5